MGQTFKWIFTVSSGVGLVMVQVPPEEVTSNAAKWYSYLATPPDWLLTSSADTYATAGFSLAFVIGVYALFMHRLPWHRAQHYHFKCDLLTIESLCRQLAAVWDDAGSYQLHSDDMHERLEALEKMKGIFVDSMLAEDFNFFMRDAGMLIASKRAAGHGLAGILQVKERNDIHDALNERYKRLKEALDHDHAQRSAAKG